MKKITLYSGRVKGHETKGLVISADQNVSGEDLTKWIADWEHEIIRLIKENLLPKTFYL